MLEGGNDNDIAKRICLNCLPIKTFDGQVVCLSSTAGKNNLTWLAANNRGNLFARLFYLLADGTPCSVKAGCISKLFDLGGEGI